MLRVSMTVPNNYVPPAVPMFVPTASRPRHRSLQDQVLSVLTEGDLSVLTEGDLSILSESSPFDDD